MSTMNITIIAICIYIGFLLLLVYLSESRLDYYTRDIEYRLEQITNRHNLLKERHNELVSMIKLEHNTLHDALKIMGERQKRWKNVE